MVCYLIWALQQRIIDFFYNGSFYLLVPRLCLDLSESLRDH